MSTSGFRTEQECIEQRGPGSYDPWFEKYGVKGFLSSKLLAEDVPADRWILSPSLPTFPQLSPRSEARREAKKKESGRQVWRRVTTGDAKSIQDEDGDDFEPKEREEQVNIAQSGPNKNASPSTPSQETGKLTGGAQQAGEGVPDFIIRKEKRPIPIQKPSSVTPARHNRETSAATVGHHHRHTPSSSGAASSFRSQGTPQPPTTSAPPPATTYPAPPTPEHYHNPPTHLQRHPTPHTTPQRARARYTQPEQDIRRVLNPADPFGPTDNRAAGTVSPARGRGSSVGFRLPIQGFSSATRRGEGRGRGRARGRGRGL